jgi:hypothetical protein
VGQAAIAAWAEGLEMILPTRTDGSLAARGVRSVAAPVHLAASARDCHRRFVNLIPARLPDQPHHHGHSG